MSIVTLCKAHSLPSCSFSICRDPLSREVEHLVYYFRERNARFSLCGPPDYLHRVNQSASLVKRLQRWLKGQSTCWSVSHAREPELASLQLRKKSWVWLSMPVIRALEETETKKINPGSVRNPVSKIHEWMRSRVTEEDTRCHPLTSVHTETRVHIHKHVTHVILTLTD